MAEMIANEGVRYERASWDVNLDGRLITIIPDRVFLDKNDTVHVQRIRNSRKTKSEPGKAIYALLRRGAAQRYPGHKVIVETLYPATGETVLADSSKDATHLRNYVGAIESIELGRFPIKPEAQVCPACPSYFICGR
jgi:hypothetical protein